MSFEVVTRDGQLVEFQTYCDGIEFQPRQRTYAITHGRAVEAPNWGVFGDGLEQPSVISLRLHINPDLYPSRAAQREAIETLDEALTTTTVLRNLADLREFAVFGGRIMAEVPTGDSYWLDVQFWPTQRRAAFADGFPLGALRVTAQGGGEAEVIALPGVTVSESEFILDGDGESFTFPALEATYG